MDNPRSDRELLAAYARRDEGAFNVFYHRYERLVHVTVTREIAAAGVTVQPEDVESAMALPR